MPVGLKLRRHQVPQRWMHPLPLAHLLDLHPLVGVGGQGNSLRKRRLRRLQRQAVVQPRISLVNISITTTR